MNKQDETKRANITMMVFVVLAILSVLFFSIKSNASETVSKKDKIEIGYQVSIESGKYKSFNEVRDIKFVTAIISAHFPDPVNIKNLLYKSNYIELHSFHCYIYVERRKIVTKKGKFKFRRLRKRDKIKTI